MSVMNIPTSPRTVEDNPDDDDPIPTKKRNILPSYPKKKKPIACSFVHNENPTTSSTPVNKITMLIKSTN